MIDRLPITSAAPPVSRAEFLTLLKLPMYEVVRRTRIGKVLTRIVQVFVGEEQLGSSLAGTIDQSDTTIDPPFVEHSQPQFEADMQLFRELAERFPILNRINRLRTLSAAYQRENFKRFQPDPITFIPDQKAELCDFLAENGEAIFPPQAMTSEQRYHLFKSEPMHLVSQLIIDNDGVITDAALLTMLATLFSGELGAPPYIPLAPGHTITADFILKNQSIVARYGEQAAIPNLLRAIATAPDENQNLMRWQFPGASGMQLELKAIPYAYKENEIPAWPDRELTPGTVLIVSNSDPNAMRAYVVCARSGMGRDAKFVMVGVGVDGTNLDRQIRHGYGQVQFSAFDLDHLLHHVTDTDTRRVFTIKPV